MYYVVSEASRTCILCCCCSFFLAGIVVYHRYRQIVVLLDKDPEKNWIKYWNTFTFVLGIIMCLGVSVVANFQVSEASFQPVNLDYSDLMLFFNCLNEFGQKAFTTSVMQPCYIIYGMQTSEVTTGILNFNLGRTQNGT